MKTNVIKRGWFDVVSTPKISAIPKGYNTAKEIAQETGLSLYHVLTKLRTLRESNQIEAIQIRGINNGGKRVWIYKR